MKTLAIVMGLMCVALPAAANEPVFYNRANDILTGRVEPPTTFQWPESVVARQSEIFSEYTRELMTSQFFGNPRMNTRDLPSPFTTLSGQADYYRVTRTEPDLERFGILD